MIEVLGVHPVSGTDEPVHLIEVAVSGSFNEVDWKSVTQPYPEQPPTNWQVAYNEQELGHLPDGRVRAVFFFHYLDVARPLQSASGIHPLPDVSPRPDHLAGIEYDPPW